MIGGFKNRNMESPLSVVLCNSANACSSLCVNATGSEHYKHFGEPLNNFSRFLDHICKEYSLGQVITASLVCRGDREYGLQHKCMLSKTLFKIFIHAIRQR